MTQQLRKTIERDFITLHIYENHVVSVIKEGVLFDLPQFASLIDFFNTYFPDSNFVLIADRKFDYTVNPTCYVETAKIDQLKGIAVICYSEASERTAAFEGAFYQKPLHICSSYDAALAWATRILDA